MPPDRGRLKLGLTKRDQADTQLCRSGSTGQ
jgi:hypothetical protein